MDEPLFKLLETIGPFGIVAVALFYVVRMAREMAPSENIQTQMFGFMKQQLDLVSELKEAIARGDERNTLALEKFTAFMETFTTQVSGDHKQSLINQAAQNEVLSQINASTEDTKEGMQGLIAEVQQMANETNLKEISDKLDTLIAEVREMRPLVEGVNSRLEQVEQAVPPLKEKIEAMAKKATGELTPVPVEKVAPAPIASPSKTQAQRKTDEQENPAVKVDDVPPQETNEKPLTDAPASGG